MMRDDGANRLIVPILYSYSDWVLEEMRQGGKNSLQDSNSRPILVKYYEKWKDFFTNEVWTVHPDPFWTYPHDYRYFQVSNAIFLVFVFVTFITFQHDEMLR